MSVSYRNRTYNRVLGGPRYIHLTKETNAVFPGFFDPLAPAAIIYNSNTFVMNYLFLISSDFSDFASLSDPQTLPFFFKRVPPWFYLRRRTLYPAELQKLTTKLLYHVFNPKARCFFSDSSLVHSCVTVHSHILVGRFHARMKICLHEYAKGAPFYEQKGAAKQRKALKARFCEWCGVNCPLGH